MYNYQEEKIKYKKYLVYQRIKDSLRDEFKLDQNIIDKLMVEFWASINDSNYYIPIDNLNNIINYDEITKEIIKEFIIKKYIEKIDIATCKCGSEKIIYNNDLTISSCGHCFSSDKIQNLKPFYKVNNHL